MGILSTCPGRSARVNGRLDAVSTIRVGRLTAVLQALVAHEGAGQEAGLAEDLEAVAGAEHEAAARHEARAAPRRRASAPRRRPRGGSRRTRSRREGSGSRGRRDRHPGARRSAPADAAPRRSRSGNRNRSTCPGTRRRRSSWARDFSFRGLLPQSTLCVPDLARAARAIRRPAIRRSRRVKSSITGIARGGARTSRRRDAGAAARVRARRARASMTFPTRTSRTSGKPSPSSAR